MDTIDLTATVHLSGVDEAVNTAVLLQEKIKEAKTLAAELDLLIEKLEVKAEMQEEAQLQHKITLPGAEELAKYYVEDSS